MLRRELASGNPRYCPKQASVGGRYCYHALFNFAMWISAQREIPTVGSGRCPDGWQFHRRCVWRRPGTTAPAEDLARSSAPQGVPLERRSFSSYDNCVVSEEQIQKWADEAEAGYEVDELKRRGRGRPGRGAEPMQVVAVRLTAEELEGLDAAASKHDMSRSEAIRAALARFAA